MTNGRKSNKRRHRRKKRGRGTGKRRMKKKKEKEKKKKMILLQSIPCWVNRMDCVASQRPLCSTTPCLHKQNEQLEEKNVLL